MVKKSKKEEDTKKVIANCDHPEVVLANCDIKIGQFTKCCIFNIANCDLKDWTWTTQEVSPSCVYSQWHRNAQ